MSHFHSDNLNDFLEDYFDNLDNRFIKLEYDVSSEIILNEVYWNHVRELDKLTKNKITNNFCQSIFRHVLNEEISQIKQGNFL
jgi:hypothetical protein